ncbi:MAG: hypothetical protein RLZZ577_64 [Bacteroidota bacterium]|jgi:hypothetical protein
MGIPVLIIGKSGMGKSTSLKTFKNEEIGLINVLGKQLPFKNKIDSFTCDDYKKITEILKRTSKKIIIIDDAGYLITNHFMKGHADAGTGNAVFAFYNKIGDNFWNLIETIKGLSADKIVYLMMHEDKNDFGDIKPKTIGKILDEKVCLEGLFTIVLRSQKSNDKYIFSTQSNGFDVAKSPMDMFEKEIDNDLKMVDIKIREYWELNNLESKEENENAKT